MVYRCAGSHSVSPGCMWPMLTGQAKRWPTAGHQQFWREVIKGDLCVRLDYETIWGGLRMVLGYLGWQMSTLGNLWDRHLENPMLKTMVCLYQCLLAETLTWAFTIHLDWTVLLFCARYWTPGLMHAPWPPGPLPPFDLPQTSLWWLSSSPSPTLPVSLSLPAAANGPWISGILSGSLRQAWFCHPYRSTENSSKTWLLRGERDPGASTMKATARRGPAHRGE